MFSLFTWFRRRIERRRLARSVSAAAILSLALELRSLMNTIRRTGHVVGRAQLSELQDRLQQIEGLCACREFSLLPVEDRLELQRFILQTREQLLTDAATGPAPTNLLQ